MRSHIFPKAFVVASSLWLGIELLRGGIPWTPAFFLALAALWLTAVRTEGQILDRRPHTAVFFIAVAAYLSTFRWHGGDDAPNSLLPFCILRYHTMALDPVINPWFIGKTNDFTLLYGAHRLSVHPVLPGMMAIPFYLPTILAGVVPNERFLHNISKLCGSTFTATSAVLFFAAVRRKCSRDWAVALTALYAFGSWAFSVSSQALWQHGTASLGLALSLWGVGEEEFIADAAGRGVLPARGTDGIFPVGAAIGFGGAIALGSRLDSVFFFAALGAFILFHRTKRLAGFVVGAAPVLAIVGGYWFYYTGRLSPPETHLQSTIVTHFQPEALIGLLVSPTRGLFFFFPAAVLGLWAAFKQRRDPLIVWLFLACLGPLILLSFYSNWVGGMTFGPRYFALAAICLIYFLAGVEKEIRSSPPLLNAFIALAMISILIHALGGYMTWPGPQAIEEEKAVLWNFSLHPIAQLFTADGWLKALPAAARFGISGVVFALFAWIGITIRRQLGLKTTS